MIMQEKLKVKIDKSLEFVPTLLQKNGFMDFEVVLEGYDFIISEEIPRESRLFIVIWEKHDVSKINALISPPAKNYNYLRGFFLKSDLQRDPLPFIEALTEARDKYISVNKLKAEAEKLVKAGQFLEVGSLVKISAKIGKDLEPEYSKPRFTTLFIDRPMLNLMFQLVGILREMEQHIGNLGNHYREEIAKIKKHRGLKKEGKETVFDDEMVKTLWEKRDKAPIRLDSILLTGDTGVGKTLIARWIHENSRLTGDFQELNASGLNANLLESELFGNVAGAWTDAKTTKPGRALLALGGVLFLDEIGEMPLEIQPKLLKFVEDKLLMPEGWAGAHPFYAPMLIVGATNKNIDTEVSEGRFRQDLYARFKYRVHVPSLEDRKESLNAIIDMILQNPLINPMEGRDRAIKYVSLEAMEKFRGIEYKENFRGLERIVRDAAYKTRDYGLDIILAETIGTETSK